MVKYEPGMRILLMLLEKSDLFSPDYLQTIADEFNRMIESPETLRYYNFQENTFQLFINHEPGLKLSGVLGSLFSWNSARPGGAYWHDIVRKLKFNNL